MLFGFAYATEYTVSLYKLLNLSNIATNTDKWYKWDILRIYLTKRV